MNIDKSQGLPSGDLSFSRSEPTCSSSSSEFKLFGWVGILWLLLDRLDRGDEGRCPKTLKLLGLLMISTVSSASSIQPIFSSFPTAALATNISLTCFACSAARTLRLWATYAFWKMYEQNLGYSNQDIDSYEVIFSKKRMNSINLSFYFFKALSSTSSAPLLSLCVYKKFVMKWKY